MRRRANEAWWMLLVFASGWLCYGLLIPLLFWLMLLPASMFLSIRMPNILLLSIAGLLHALLVVAFRMRLIDFVDRYGVAWYWLLFGFLLGSLLAWGITMFHLELYTSWKQSTGFNIFLGSMAGGVFAPWALRRLVPDGNHK